MSDFELRTHIQVCTEHNNLYMGRFSPALNSVNATAVAVPVPLPPPVPFPYTEPLAIAVPLPPQQYQNFKVADL